MAFVADVVSAFCCGMRASTLICVPRAAVGPGSNRVVVGGSGGDVMRVMASEGVEEPEEGAEPGVPGLNAPADLPGAVDDLAGDLDEDLQEGAELHAQ